MDATPSSETLVNIYQTTQHHIPEDIIFNESLIWRVDLIYRPTHVDRLTIWEDYF
jgi:hypothetical protein